VLVARSKLPQSFIQQYFNQLKPYQIERLQELDDDIIEAHASELNWFSLLRFQTLSEKTIEANISKIKSLNLWKLLLKTQKLSLEFLINHIEDIKADAKGNLDALNMNALIDDSVKSKVTELAEVLQ
jgi:hypothetical protein